ncbi:MAG: acetyltransferase [Leptolyngbyaceae cyanobacterium RU_5_1]|nr:acetyltransferase [Leptolyngbyaceae cyanobacterium RU_5_1]
MFLQNRQTGVLVKVLNTDSLIDPMEQKISGRIQDGQEEQDPEEISKNDLVFPSGERLPRCWMDVDYRSH